MRTIVKSAEPASLTEHRNSPHADYENYSGKSELRQALCTEQRGLCCYCLSRIRPGGNAMKIAALAFAKPLSGGTTRLPEPNRSLQGE